MAKRVELLAPCGSYESFLAAVNAGADAVYLGGRQFGARAYAENFSEEELVSVIRKAHLWGVQVYLTVNTLVKEDELSGLYDWMKPLYEAGLDGVIVQEMGVFCFLQRNFPALKLHASTQMTITGAYGAAYLKKLGCERIVPARELSLQEIKEIKSQVDIEIEAFIHGAMCYCYSGQCLMSSMIGGRSGNRGRCAGPCRLPYRVAGKEGYYLSLKDMNTLEHIPELIEAGIDSFKIEGRMKKPEYVAGVVSVYRKYIDRYYGKGRTGSLEIDPRDKKLLADLYIRSETGNGYYEKRNGKDMLTLHKPGYNEADSALLKKLREDYIHELPQTEISLFAECREGKPFYGEVRFADFKSGDARKREICLSVSGDMVQRADKRAVSGEEMKAQLRKTGGTPFAVTECTVEAGENVFVPMGWIKGLRRELLQKIYEYYGARAMEVRAEERAEKIGNELRERANEQRANKAPEPPKSRKETECRLTVMVQTREQFEAVFSALEKSGDTLIADADLLLEDAEIQEKLSAGEVRWGIKCPVILRKSDADFLNRLQTIIEEKKPKIVYCATIDMLAWLKQISYPGEIAGEASLYAWNSEAVSFWGGELDLVSIPLELRNGEIRKLCMANRNAAFEAPVYGRTPFMVSANCIKLSTESCDRNRKQYAELTDRMGNIFPVYTNCAHCYNIIYNYLPTSYLENLWMLREDGIRAFRLEFTTEKGREAAGVLQTFQLFLASELAENKPKKEKRTGTETTKGRFRLGVE